MTADRLTGAAAVIAAAGLAIAAYLTYVHYAGIDAVCSTGGCERVQSSDYAQLAGLPVALLGLAGYAGILVALRMRGEAARAAAAFLALVGFGYSAYLTWIELARIDAVCQWCVASAGCMTALAVLATARWLKG
jgi:uncharacterized membrane protein